MSLTDTIDPDAGLHTYERNSSFSRELPNLQIALDATSLSAFKTCPRYYELSILKGYQLGGMALTDEDGVTVPGEENPHLKFGILYHSASEVYDHARAQGADHESALRAALRHALIEAHNPETKTMWQSSDSSKNLNSLLRSLVWYFDKFADDPLKTYILPDGKPAVELSFSFDLRPYGEVYTAPTGEPYLLCGHLDRVVEWNDELYIVDKKTTKGYLGDSYFANYSPDTQVSLYTIAGQVVLHKNIEGVIIDAAQIQANGSKFMRRPISRSPGQLEEWLNDLVFYLRLLEAYARVGYYPQNDQACGKYGGCRFRQVCSADPAVRQDILDAFYTKRGWDPLKVREEPKEQTL